MTRQGSFKKVVRRHAGETGQRYTQALTNLEGLQDRMFHDPAAERLLAHLRDRYGIDAIAATKASQHNDHVFCIDLRDGDAWIARYFPPARPKLQVDGDAAILRFLERHDHPAERLAVEDAVSDLDGSSVLVTRYVPATPLPAGREGIVIMGDMLGRLHALPLEASIDRAGGASGEDPMHTGSPRQDLVAALSFLDAVATKVHPADCAQFEQLRAQVRTSDDGAGLPEALVHGNLLHNPDHVVIGAHGPVAINWKSAGRGPRISDLAWLLWGAPFAGEGCVEAAVHAYRQHIEVTSDEIDRLGAVMLIRPLYLACFVFRRNILEGKDENAMAFIDPGHIAATANAVRKALRT